MPLNLVGTPADTTRAEKVYRLLRDHIISGELRPGEKLDILELSSQLRVSRTPVKEAFNRLAHEGLVEIHPQRGTFISRLSPNSVVHLFDVRLMMELWGARQLDGGTSFEAFERILRESELLFEREGEFDYARFNELDSEFHTIIVEGSRNPKLTELYRSLNAHIQLMRTYWGRARERARQSHTEHAQVVEAFRSGRAEAVEVALRAHLLSSRDSVVAFLQDAATKSATK